MFAVTKRLVLGKPAAAQSNGSASAQSELLAVSIDYREIPFDANGTVIEYYYFCCHGAIVADTGRYNGYMLRAFILAGLLIATTALAPAAPCPTFNEHQGRKEGRFLASGQIYTPAPHASADVSLPPGLTVQVQLLAPIDSEKSKAGDAIEAMLASSIKQNKRVLFDKGSRVEGRLIRMQKLGTTIQAEMQFSFVTNGNRRAAFTATPQVESPPKTPANPAPQTGRPQFSAGDRAGSVRISIEGSRLTLLRGSRSVWITSASTPKGS